MTGKSIVFAGVWKVRGRRGGRLRNRIGKKMGISVKEEMILCVRCKKHTKREE